MPENIQTTLQIIAIVATIATLLGWVVKRIINYFIKHSEALQEYSKQLVAQNQENVENFVNTINHNQTKFNASIDHLSVAIGEQTEVFKKVINKPKRKIKK